MLCTSELYKTEQLYKFEVLQNKNQTHMYKSNRHFLQFKIYKKRLTFYMYTDINKNG